MMIMLLALAAVAGANEAHEWVIRDPLQSAAPRMSSSTRSNSVPTLLRHGRRQFNRRRAPRRWPRQRPELPAPRGLHADHRRVRGRRRRTARTARSRSLRCDACNAVTSLSDSSNCTKGETSCAANQRLVERDASGNVVQNICEGCPSRQFITTIDTSRGSSIERRPTNARRARIVTWPTAPRRRPVRAPRARGRCRRGRASILYRRFTA